MRNGRLDGRIPRCPKLLGECVLRVGLSMYQVHVGHPGSAVAVAYGIEPLLQFVPVPVCAVTGQHVHPCAKRDVLAEDAQYRGSLDDSAADLPSGVSTQASPGLCERRAQIVTRICLQGGRGNFAAHSLSVALPPAGARVRYAVAPGHELFLRGDIGGFGVGSDFSWQAVGGYGFDFGTWNGITFSGVIGYRALSVDYAEGEGRRRYEFDMLQHGPVLGLGMRF